MPIFENFPIKEPLATISNDGLMSKADKTKLDSINLNADGGIIVKPNASDVAQDSEHRFVTDTQIAEWNAKINSSEKGVANGVATLDENGHIPSSQLPSYVDDVIEGTLATFPETGEAAKIYVDTATNITYRWSGTQYTVIGSDLALGETASTAYAGDKGKATTDAVNAILDGTTSVPKATDAATVNGKTVETNVPADAVFTDTVYTHPESHEAAMITQDATHKFVTDAQIAEWNAKASTAVATTSTNGLMSATDKTKLDSLKVVDIENMTYTMLATDFAADSKVIIPVTNIDENTNITIGLDYSSVTTAQYDAAGLAKFVTKIVETGIEVSCFGTVPTIDIPVVLSIVRKA